MSAVQQRSPDFTSCDEQQLQKHRFRTIAPQWAQRAAEILAQSKPVMRKSEQNENKITVNPLTLELFIDFFEGMRRG